MAGTAGGLNLDLLIETASAMAEAAAYEIRQHYRQGVAIDDKADETPVTAADRGAEAAMRRLLGARFPGHGIIGEEYGVEREDADFLWILDPIDGTKSFVTGCPLFGTLIALLHEGRPILGIINMPMLGERWTGTEGRPTLFRGADGHEGPVHCRPCATLGDAYFRTTSLEMFDPDDLPALDLIRKACKQPIYGGDCYNYGLLASGYCDLVVEADLKSYDYMALIPVVTGAGGLASDWEGRALGTHSDGHVVMSGDPALHGDLLTRLAEL